MATTSVRDASLQAMLECIVCFERLQNPRLLACGHHFCENCLVTLATQNQNRTIECPKCRRETDLANRQVTDLPRHYMAGELLDRTEGLGLLELSPKEVERDCDVCKNDAVVASTRCQACFRNMCYECSEKHRKITAFKSHKTVPITEFLFCGAHPQVVVALYCTRCNVGVCLDCAIKEHSDHNTRDIEELAAETRESIRAFLDAPEVKHDDTTMIAAIEGAQKKIQKDRETYKSDIAKYREALQNALAKLRQTNTDLATNVTSEVNTLKQIEEELTSLNATRQNLRQLAGSLLKESSDVEVVVRGEEVPPPSTLEIHDEYVITQSRPHESVGQMSNIVKEFTEKCVVLSENVTVRP